MDAARRARPQVEPFEDRVVPSRGGFDHGPDHPDGPRAAVVRDQPHGFDHADPFVGAAPARRDPEVTFTLVRAAARTDTAAAEPATRLVAAAQAEPAAVAASHLPPTEAHAAAASPSAIPAGLPAPGVLIDAGVAGVRAAAFTTTAVLAASADDALPLVEVAPAPVVPESSVMPPPAWEFPPLLVEVPGAVPLAGVLGVDLVAVEAGVRQALDAVADIVPIPADGWGVDGWLAVSAVLLGGAGWAGARARRPRPTPDAVFLGWGERDDRRRG